jgi:UDP-N-acetylmuramyl-tripeptide synthetase
VKLSKLITGLAVADMTRLPSLAATEDPEITSIHYKSQEVKKGGLFVAIEGRKADGHDFIHMAIDRGASAIVARKPVAGKPISVQVGDTRRALALISSRFYGHPSEKLMIVGITGTNGKTTTAFLTESILKKAGFNTGNIGTIDYRYQNKTFPNPLTTPESLDLQRILAEMVQNGVTHVVMEVSSHALDLSRIENCWIDVGVFTNLSQDHLDFHKNMRAYWNSKKRLFTEILSSGPKKSRTRSVINCNDEKGKVLFNMMPDSSISTGSAPDHLIRGIVHKADLAGIDATIYTPQGDFPVRTSLIGLHNRDNILMAVGVGIATGVSLSAIKAGIENLPVVPGRFELIPNPTGRVVVVDYAHTPGALEKSLLSIRSLSQHRVLCVFGCGGDRDKDKRPLMGEIAGRLADLSIITSDNPRGENPMTIIEQVLPGTRRSSPYAYTVEQLKNGFEKKGYVVESDREKAIRLSLSTARPGDVVIIAGKGHENYQVIGDRTIWFDDKEVAKSALSRLKAA